MSEERATYNPACAKCGEPYHKYAYVTTEVGGLWCSGYEPQQEDDDATNYVQVCTCPEIDWICPVHRPERPSTLTVSSEQPTATERSGAADSDSGSSDPNSGSAAPGDVGKPGAVAEWLKAARELSPVAYRADGMAFYCGCEIAIKHSEGSQATLQTIVWRQCLLHGNCGNDLR